MREKEREREEQGTLGRGNNCISVLFNRLNLIEFELNYTRARVYIYIYIYIYTHNIHIYIHIYIHTYTYIYIFSPYRAVNTLRLGYTNQSVNVV